MRMHLYFDESGDFAFADQRFDAYVQAALICPDSFVDKIEHYVHNAKRELGVDELHAAELPDEQLIEICRFLDGGPLSLVAQVTDTRVMTDAQITEHRQEQAALLERNLEQYKQADGKWEGAEAWYMRHIKRAALASRINNSEYVQSDLFVNLIHAALFKSIVRYLDDAWRDDLVEFHLILDGKLPGKLAAGEKELNVLLMPRLGSNDNEFVIPTTWYDEPVHPFVSKFGTDSGKLSLNRIFERGLRFEESHTHAGLQLVDVVAYVVRKAIVEPENNTVSVAYGLIRENLRTERAGQALRLVRYTTGQDNLDDDRYRAVL
jgi:hypothetical protein